MKKLGISIFALLVSLPMAAKAELGTFGETGLTQDNGTIIATTKYVKGAYDTLATAINANESAIAGKQAQLVNDADPAVNINNQVLTSVGQTGDNTHLVTEKAVRDAIDAATTGLATSTDLNAKQNTIDSSHKLSADLVDDSQSTNKFISSAQASAITSNTSAINTLNGNASTTGSVANTVAGAINDLNLSTTYQAKNDSTVATGTYNHIGQGSGVAANLIALDTAIGEVATGTYNKISASNSVAANLIALDTAIGNMETQWQAPSVQQQPAGN